ncbi:MAG: S9 family peptidase [Verrucomicrobiales bacterium]|jgi:oligopeptidase B|nr:S9 family peptidase [Verrucomicrobiales bacterium]
MQSAFLFILMSLALSSSPLLAGPAPVAEKRPHPLSVHGVGWSDDYFWLRERENPAVKAHLKAENAYLAAELAPLKPLRETLVAEMKSRIIEEDISVPYRRGLWLYYSREVAGKDHPLICRKPWHGDKSGELLEAAAPGTEVVLLDLNERAGGNEAYTFGGGAVSPDTRLYAWKENSDGTDRFTIRFKILETDELLPDEVTGAVFDAAPVWAADNETIFYTEADETDRSWRVRRHRLGAPETENDVVYEEPDARFQVGIEATKSREFLLISSASKDTAETLILPLRDGAAEPQVFVPRSDGRRYSLADCDGHWYILTNEDAVNGRLFRTPLDRTARESWEEVIPGDEKIAYEGIDSFATHVILSARQDAVPGFFILDPDTGTRKWISAPGQGGSMSSEPTPEYGSTTQRFSYETLLQPYTVAEVDLASGETRVLKQKALPPGYDPDKYRIERTFATADDGTRLPIWLLLPRDHPRDGSGGLLLDGYGAYGIASDPWFDSDVFSLLDRGVGFAIAQVRGGGEYGRLWYEAGKMENKMTTFTDFITCAEHLIAEKYTSTPQLCGSGASAGGLLAGAVLNRRPDLFGAYIANVPFVDVLNTMLDATLPLTTSEYDEWGNPEAVREVFDRIRGYSPYDNVKAQAYPAILVLAGWNDNRVSYWEPAKWVARMRAVGTGTAPLYLSTAFETGHGGASGRYSGLEEVALQYAFVLKALGRINPPAR